MHATKFDLNAYLRDDSNLRPEFAALLKRRMENGSHWKEAWAGRLTPRQVRSIKCADGLEMSVQASETHYCTPAKGALGKHYGPWDEVEIGFPNQRVEELMEYAEDPSAPTDTVYAYVPVSLVEDIIEKHGGIVTT